MTTGDVVSANLIDFKVQKPLLTTNETMPWLFYNEDRSVVFELPNASVPKELKEHMKEQDLSKCFVRGFINAKDQFQIVGFIQDQEW